MDESVITWNVPNFVTVVLMAALAVALLFLIRKTLAAKKQAA